MDTYCNCECSGIFCPLENSEISKKNAKKIGKLKYFHIKIFCILKQF